VTWSSLIVGVAVQFEVEMVSNGTLCLHRVGWYRCSLAGGGLGVLDNEVLLLRELRGTTVEGVEVTIDTLPDLHVSHVVVGPRGFSYAGEMPALSSRRTTTVQRVVCRPPGSGCAL
jgi:hypothetical protein